MNQLTHIERAWPLMLGFALIGVVGAAVIAWRSARRTSLDRRRRLGAVTFWLWLSGAAFCVAYPRPPEGGRLVTVFIGDGPGSGLLNFVANVAMFAPAGAIPVLAKMRWRAFAVPFAFLLTVGIEVGQYVGDFGRTADVNDVVANTAGALVGFSLALVIVGAEWCVGRIVDLRAGAVRV